jgi:hypothetical protein
MQRLNRIEHSYFDSIDTEYKAYILGFIYADGCIVDNDSCRQKSLRIFVQWEDGYILEQLLKDITVNRTLRKRHPPAAIKAGEKPQAGVSINSDQICTQLIQYGCNIKKSLVGMTLPVIPSSLYHHFVRGFFDGDGCITVGEIKNRYSRISCRNLSKPFRRKLRKRVFLTSTDQQFLIDILNNTKLQFKQKLTWTTRKRVQITWVYGIENLEDVETFREYIYRDATVFLKRKFDKFNMTIKSEAEDTSSERVETT